ncbi:beta-galactosidase GalB [Neptunitalea chrysea]|uniref:beta-galactosidase GalB n=1 Tax=Neptunitalea chrysea TaxID=1647581 RepID=UPI00248FFC54|nr:beta-galactosidase GalB [Neptunitalea chrysea]
MKPMTHANTHKKYRKWIQNLFILALLSSCNSKITSPLSPPRERISLNNGWTFFKYDSEKTADSLCYDLRPEIKEIQEARPADQEPTAPEIMTADNHVLKPYILPTGNEFLADSSKHYKRPQGDPGSNFPFVQYDFDDSAWEQVNLPHDWAINGPFMEGWNAKVGGGMGRLPSDGIAWYRKKIDIPISDQGKSIYLDLDGAMSYAIVWVNGHLVGGWPYGYSSWRVALTPYLNFGAPNQIAIRIDNPNHSSRWYPGGGIYRNVWLVKTHSLHIDHWGTRITSTDVSSASAIISMDVKLKNTSGQKMPVEILTKIYESEDLNKVITSFPIQSCTVDAYHTSLFSSKVTLQNPKLWGPPPTQSPNLYVAVTEVKNNGQIIDRYETTFGVRTISYDANKGIFVNGEKIYIQGVNQHHDLGSLGAAFNVKAAKRQLTMLAEMGVNAIRLAHNPPAPELLDLTDKMGFLVVDEMFDGWQRKKNPHDFHLIFDDWYEQDVRAWVRRDKNHPSIIIWSTGNEVGEQYTGISGAEISKRLKLIVKEEDPTRPVTASMNYAKPDMPLPETLDVISLNYQGEGIRNAPAYAHLKGINTAPLYPKFHKTFPDKVILSSENAAALSSRGTYIFPVTERISAPVSDSTGGDSKNMHVSAYELYTAPFGSSADKVFASLDQHPYVAGGFVWSGWDYLGEPSPYYLARSSYYGVIDLAGFKKDRFYLYQSKWRPNFPMAHILPHWNWPDRIGKKTPVHVFTSGDEAELFLNGKSMGRKKKGAYEYRLRWDTIKYNPGTLKVIAYKNGQKWAEDSVTTSMAPHQLKIETVSTQMIANGEDLCFVTVQVVDAKGIPVPTANNEISFEISGPGVFIASDNGDPSDMTSFGSSKRNAFNGKILAILKSTNTPGIIQLTARASGLQSAQINIHSVIQ